MSEFTPGPWRTHEFNDCIIVDGDGVMVCQTDNFTPFIEKKPMRKQVANARLIAASPDLLEACKAAVKELNEIRARDGVPYCFDGRKSDVDPNYFSSVVESLFAAIAKATGERQ